jgi:hypothetical protein
MIASAGCSNVSRNLVSFHFCVIAGADNVGILIFAGPRSICSLALGALNEGRS